MLMRDDEELRDGVRQMENRAVECGEFLCYAAFAVSIQALL